MCDDVSGVKLKYIMVKTIVWPWNSENPVDLVDYLYYSFIFMLKRMHINISYHLICLL